MSKRYYHLWPEVTSFDNLGERRPSPSGLHVPGAFRKRLARSRQANIEPPGALAQQAS
jgi:hypothetical protein